MVATFAASIGSPCATLHTKLISKNEVMRSDIGGWLAAKAAWPTFSPAIYVGFAAVRPPIISTRATPIKSIELSAT